MAHEPLRPQPDAPARGELLRRALARAAELLPGAEAGPHPATIPEPGPFVRAALDRAADRAMPEGLLAVIAPRYPVRGLLGSPEPLAPSVLRTLIRREIGDALELAKPLPADRLTRWVEKRLCGPEPLSGAHRRQFLITVADAIREAREAAARSVVGDRTSEHTTLAELAQGTSLSTIAPQESEAAMGLAWASRKLEAGFPKLGEVFLLWCYAGVPALDLATLTHQTLDTVQEQLADASDWVLAQAV